MYFLIINYFPEAETSMRGVKCGERENMSENVYCLLRRRSKLR